MYSNHLKGNHSSSTFRRKLIESGHFSDEKEVTRYLKSTCQVQFVVIQDDAERTTFEHFALAILRPKYND
ncbi:MAG: hypothetical protein ACE5K8_09310 [Candidatus Zixiibacteriota bacterium]